MKHHTLKSRSISYDLMESLGEGLNSVVYKAVRADPLHHLNQTVALKILKSKNLVDLWKKEFASLQKVICKHCVRVYGFEWLGDRPVLVLEFVDGISLRQLCLAGPLPKDLSREIFAQIQTGLISLKEQGLTHGDLSPNNVMIDNMGLVRLLDFGWANSSEGRVQTTHAFAAPEVLKGEPPTYESDLYSLGALEKMMTQKKSSRLSENRSERSPFPFESSERAREKLGAHVRRVRDYQNRFVQMVTKSLIVSKKVRLSILHAFAMIFIIAFAPDSQSWRSSLHDFGLLRIRTQQWTKLKLNGVEVGFAPQDLLLKGGRRHELSWQDNMARGKLAVQLSNKQVQVINEEDLHSLP